MNTKILKAENKLCPCCMEEHVVQTVQFETDIVFKETEVKYTVECFYCDNADEYFEDSEQMNRNDISMKNAYREKVGLLTSH